MSLQGLFQRILNCDNLRHLFLPLKICNLYTRIIFFILWDLFHNINFVIFVLSTSLALLMPRSNKVLFISSFEST